MTIVVILPTYNEKANIEKMIPVLEEEVFPKIKNHSMLLLVADDHSPDGTAQAVKAFGKKWKNIHLLMGNKEGLGSAYVRAMKYAMEKLSADAVIEFDSDFQHDPHDIPRLIEAMDNGADYVIGSRYVKGGKIPKEWGIDRKVQSIFGSIFARIVLFTFGIHDMTSGFKLTKTSFLKKVDLDNLYSKNYSYKIQILYEVVKLGAKVKEVPIIFYERAKGKSKMNTNNIVESFLVVLKIRMHESRKFIKFLMVGGTGFMLNFIVYFILGHFTTVNLVVANTIGAELAIFSNFNLNNLWTFNDNTTKTFSSYMSKMLQYFATSNIGIWIFQNGMIQLGSSLYGRKYYLVYFIFGTALLLVWNFTIYNKIIWKKPRSS